MAVRRRSIVELEQTLTDMINKIDAEREALLRDHRIQAENLVSQQMSELARLEGRLEMAVAARALAALPDVEEEPPPPLKRAVASANDAPGDLYEDDAPN